MPPHSNPPLPDLSGHPIDDDGRYRLHNLLGEGGFGAVYRAQDTQASSEEPTAFCAIKCMRKHISGSRRAEYQTREIALHQLVSDHPNVVSVHHILHSSSLPSSSSSSSQCYPIPDPGRDMNSDGYMYMVLDLCSGGDLLKAITSKKFVRNDELVRRTFLQIIDGLKHCHGKGVFHRDLKPENILLSEDGTAAYLADFGLASPSETSREFGCGSKRFLSPECIGAATKKATYSHRTNDVWALGIILTAMLTNRYPWRMAVPLDPCFVAFCHDPMWLYNNLDISDEAYRVLVRIFDVDHKTRIGLDDLREMVEAVGTFFPCESEMSIRTLKERQTSGPVPPRIPTPASSSEENRRPTGPQQPALKRWGQRARLPQVRRNNPAMVDI